MVNMPDMPCNFWGTYDMDSQYCNRLNWDHHMALASEIQTSIYQFCRPENRLLGKEKGAFQFLL